MVVHPAPGNQSQTLVNALINHCGTSLSGIGGEKRPGIVHRLDKDTSGLIVVAKNDKSHNGLSEQFKNHGKDCLLLRFFTNFFILSSSFSILVLYPCPYKGSPITGCDR